MKPKLLFITGSQKKADYLAKYLGFPVDHVKIDLDEIQSMDLKEIVEYKARQAFAKVKVPVIVEDVSLEIESLGRLPGPFIRFFIEQMSLEDICSIVGNKTRKATAKCVFGYFDGETLELFEGGLEGEIALEPSGENGFGFDKIFIPKGYSETRASLGEEDDKKTYLQIKPFEKVKNFLESRNK